MIISPHVGQGNSEPAPLLSTDNSWPHLGQLKMISINAIWADDVARLTAPRSETNKKFLPPRFGEAVASGAATVPASRCEPHLQSYGGASVLASRLSQAFDVRCSAFSVQNSREARSFEVGRALRARRSKFDLPTG